MKAAGNYTHRIVGHVLVALCGTVAAIIILAIGVIVKIAMPH